MARWLLVLACAFWGLSFPVIKALQFEQAARLPAATETFLAVWLQAARFGLAALLLSPVVFILRPTRTELTQGVQLAFWGGSGMALQAWGLAFTEASTSAFLTQAYCVFLPLIACLTTRSLPGWRLGTATLMVVAGSAILSGLGPGSFSIGKGEVATIGSALLFTFQILCLESPRYRTNRGMVTTFAMCGFIFLLFAPLAILLAPGPAVVLAAGASWPAATLVLALAVLCSVAAYGLMNSWQPQVPATEAGLIYTTEPVFTALFVLFLPQMLGLLVGTTYPNEPLTIPLVIGGSLIVAANLIMQWKRQPHPPAIAPVP